MAVRAVTRKAPVRAKAEQRLTEDQFLDAVTSSVRARLSTVDLRSAVQLGPDRTAELMVGSIPREHPYDRQIGPFYDAAGVMRMLGIPSKQALADRARRLTLLQVKTSNGRSLFPAFQFGSGRVLPGVGEALKAFRGVPVDGWAIASWFTTPAESLGGGSPVERLAGSRADADAVRALAEETAERWSAP